MRYDKRIMQNNPHETPERTEADGQTHFGFQTVPESNKAGRVAEVFHSVASCYDVMNDLMSLGLHRVWKAFTIGRAQVRPGMREIGRASCRERVCQYG